MCNLIWPFTRPLVVLLVLVISQLAWAQNEESVSTTTSTPESGVDVPAATQSGFERAVVELTQGSLSKRGQAIKKLASLNDERAAEIIEALQEGNLSADKSDKPVVAVKQTNGSFIHAFSGMPLSANETEKLKRVPITNAMRNQLHTLLAQINFNHTDPNIRYHAVQRIISDGVDEENLALLQARQAIEPSEKVRDAIAIAQALYNSQSDNSQIRFDAVAVMKKSLLPEVRATLTQLANSDPDKKVSASARQALDAIEDRITTFRLTENIFFGLSLGSVLLLSAIGLAITFGVMGVINMAHGELMMIGAYTTWVVQQIFPNHIAYSLLIAVPAAFIVAGLVGIAIERGVIRFLYGRPLETLLATFGISLILQQAARSIFSPLNRAVSLPEWMSGSMIINPVFSITYNRLYILIFGLVVFLGLIMILKKTSLGLKVRAVSQNRAMARAVGVRASWVDAMTFGLGSGVAGIAGVALSQLTNVGPNLGQAYIIDSFMVVVFGGVGNLWGTLVGAMGLGIINKFLEPYAGAVLAKVLVLVLLILFIQKRPKGIFPQKGRAAAD